MIRGITLRGAVCLNVITMIGIGPLITIPLVLAALPGPLALTAWVLGAIVALCDGLVWAELGSRYPGSGGTYVYLREAFGAEGSGKLLAFLFNWQFLLSAPLLLASGYIGFANYLGYLVPSVAASYWLRSGIAVTVGALVIILLYRKITAVATIGMFLAVGAIGTLVLVIAASFSHPNMTQAFTVGPPLHGAPVFLVGLGTGLIIALYDYAGYSDAALLGDEVRSPERTIPWAIVISVLLVALLYILLQIGVLGAVPWHSLFSPDGSPSAQAGFVASTVVANNWGTWAARIVTCLILLTAFASVYGNLLGFARIPYAAATDNAFFPFFAKLHPGGQFPHVALLTVGIASLAAAFLPLDFVITALTAGIALIQSVAQIIGLFVIRARGEHAPFRMWLYPVPAIIALLGWLFAFYSTGTGPWGAKPIAVGLAWLIVGACTYLFIARSQQAWPFRVRSA